MNNKKYINKNITYNICLTAILMGLTLSSYYLMNSLPLGVIGSFDIHLLFYIFGIVLIKEKQFKLFFFAIIPFLSIFNTNILAVNYLQIFVEYFLVYYCFFVFLFFDKIFFVLKNKKILLLVFILFVFFSYSLRLLLHVFSGIVWWGANDILTSFIINIRMLILDWIIIIPTLIISSSLIFSLKKMIS